MGPGGVVACNTVLFVSSASMVFSCADFSHWGFSHRGIFYEGVCGPTSKLVVCVGPRSMCSV